MSDERKRFSARYTRDPRLAVGVRHVFPGDRLFEEWSMGARPRPDRIETDTHRPGDVIRVIEPRPQDGRDWWTVWAEDPAPAETPIDVVVTILGPLGLADPDDLLALLEHLSSNEIRNDVEAAEVARACTPWLASRFPRLTRAIREMPRYPEVMYYRAWLDGVQTGLGYDTVRVPLPPFTFIREKRLDSLNLSGNLHVRPDVLNRLGGNNVN